MTARHARPPRLAAAAFWSTAIAIAPVLLVQALYTALRTPRLPEAAPGRHSATGATADLLVVGESTAVGVGVDALDEALAGQLSACLFGDRPARWCVIGCNGARVSAMRTLVAAAEVPRAGLVVVLLGVNDTVKLTPLRRFQSHVRALVALLHERGAGRVVIPAVPPVGWFSALPRPLRWLLGWRARQLDAALRGVDAHFEHLSLAFPPLPELLAPDGYHPSARGYALWARLIADTLSDTPAIPPAPAARDPQAMPADDRQARSAASVRD